MLLYQTYKVIIYTLSGKTINATLKIKNHIRIIYLVCFILFVINKAYVRKILLQKEYPQPLEILSYSIPNFFEAVLGTSILVAILLTLKFKNVGFLKNVKSLNLKLFGVGFSLVYVVTQELKFHNLGGRNVYDFNDLIASLIGIAFIAFVILRYGVTDLEENTDLET